jgi:sigma-54 specific flagellar transcriptional regulator A
LNLEDFVARLEHDLIEQSLARTGGNKGHAARLLQMKRTTLVEKLKRMHRKSVGA